MGQPKTAAQLAKRAKNIAEAAARLKELQTTQLLANHLRSKGYVGTDEAVIAKAAEDQELLVKQRQEQQANSAAQETVNRILSVPKAGVIVRRWLKERITIASVPLLELINKFLDRDGTGGTPDNSALKTTIMEALYPSEQAAA